MVAILRGAPSVYRDEATRLSQLTITEMGFSVVRTTSLNKNDCPSAATSYAAEATLGMIAFGDPACRGVNWPTLTDMRLPLGAR